MGGNLRFPWPHPPRSDRARGRGSRGPFGLIFAVDELLHGDQAVAWTGRFRRWGLNPDTSTLVECSQVFASWWRESMDHDEWVNQWALLVAESTPEITDADQAAIDAFYAQAGFPKQTNDVE